MNCGENTIVTSKNSFVEVKAYDKGKEKRYAHG